MSDDDDTLVVPIDGPRAITRLAASLALLAASTFLALADRAIPALIGAAFFGYCTAEWAFAALRRPGLQLNSEGIKMRSAFLTRTYRWRELKRVGVFGAGPWQLVGLEIESRRGKRRLFRWLSRALTGFDSGLPNCFVLGPPQLADVLSQWRARWASERGDHGANCK